MRAEMGRLPIFSAAFENLYFAHNETTTTSDISTGARPLLLCFLDSHKSKAVKRGPNEKRTPRGLVRNKRKAPRHTAHTVRHTAPSNGILQYTSSLYAARCLSNALTRATTSRTGAVMGRS